MLQNRWAIAVAAGIIGLVTARLADAQDPAAADLKARLDRVEKENEQLLQQFRQLQMMPPSPTAGGAKAPGGGLADVQADSLGQNEVKSIVNQYFQDLDGQKMAAADAAKAKSDQDGYKVGTDLNMSATWNTGLLVETANKDFTLHFGAWFQLDNVFWTQSPALITPKGAFAGPKQGVASGPGLGGIGDLQDGADFRRIRLQSDGIFFENFEYNVNYAFENNQFSSVGLENFWVGAKDVPVIGTIRVGHFKTPSGLEAGSTANSLALTFMEQSAYGDAIEVNQSRVTGLWLGNTYLDERTTWSFAAFRQDDTSWSGAFFGDGQYGLQGRLTALPIYEDDGRCLVHLGLGGGWRANTNTSPYRTIELRARPEMRDDDAAASPSGGEPVPNANSTRMIDTGVIAAPNDWLMGLEFLWIQGPFSLQAEYGFNWVSDAIGANPSGLTLTPLFKTPQDYMFSGGYMQLAYTLTGENRAYDKRLGRLNTFYFGREGPYNNAWVARDENGNIIWNTGAWEIAARYSYVNLNDGIGADRIQGGVMNGLTLGLNWYLNVNLKVMFDYVYNQRADLPVGVTPGSTRGLGTRIQFSF